MAADVDLADIPSVLLSRKQSVIRLNLLPAAIRTGAGRGAFGSLVSMENTEPNTRSSIGAAPELGLLLTELIDSRATASCGSAPPET